VKIIWDEPKRVANLSKHGFDFRDITLEFFAASIFIPAKGRRFKAVGRFDGRMITVIAAPLGAEGVSIVSMRPASRSERDVF
jgi:uncharacterized protein